MINNNKNGHINNGSRQMETNKTNNKKVITIIVVALILLILVVGATYAYFTGNIISNSSKTNVKATTSAIDNIALNQQVSKLHITINPNDMGENNKQDYYATEDTSKNYEKMENIVSLAELTATGGDARAAYNCEVKVTLSIDDSSTMLEYLQAGDANVYLQYGNLLENIDLIDLKTTKSKELTGNITLINNSNDYIRGSLKITNNENNQIDLANKTLNVNINTEVTKCELYGTSKIELALRNTNSSGTLSKELKGGMYRYQGQASEVTDNYICFGTDNKTDCLADQNHYMYRIIGVTPEGRLKLIKKEALDKTYQWYTDYHTDIKLLDSTFLKAINGADFLQNTDYIPAEWEEKIANSTWLYGDMRDNYALGAKQLGEGLYDTESGHKSTSWYIESTKEDGGIPYQVQREDNDKYSQGTTLYYKTKSGNWSETIKSKISLMYLNDYSYSVGDNAQCNYYYEEPEYAKCKLGWMHLSQNYISAKSLHEWTMSRNGWNTWYGSFHGFFISDAGYTSTTILTNAFSVRPVFYLNNDIEISGKGTIDDPYMIKL